MRKPVEIALRGIPHSDALESCIGEEADKLERVCHHILSCNVVAEALQRQKQRGARFSVQLNIALPGTEVVVNREHREDVYVALRDAFQAAAVQLKEHARRQTNTGRRSLSATPEGDRER
jgi:ribosomal subunit interface protein